MITMRLVTVFAPKTAPLDAGVQPRFQELILRIEGRASGTVSADSDEVGRAFRMKSAT
jgi:hypothetical protein